MHYLSSLCCFGHYHPLPSLFGIEVQYMEGEIPTWDLNDLLWELLPPEPTLSPYYFVFLLYIYLFNYHLLCSVFSFK